MADQFKNRFNLVTVREPADFIFLKSENQRQVNRYFHVNKSPKCDFQQVQLVVSLSYSKLRIDKQVMPKSFRKANLKVMELFELRSVVVMGVTGGGI